MDNLTDSVLVDPLEHPLPIVKPQPELLSSVNPPQSHSEEMIQALEDHGDQAQSAERDIAPGLTLTIGLRNVYLNNDGDVAVLARIRRG